MPNEGQSRANESVNVLLKFPLEERMGGDVVAALESPDRDVRREALRDIEAYDLVDSGPPQIASRETAQRIAAKLARGGQEGVASVEQDGAEILSIDEIDPIVGPPEGRPVFNPYTGVLSVYPREGAPEAIADISDALNNEEGVQAVEPVVVYRAIAALDRTLATEPEIAGYGGGLADLDEDGTLWEEAALQARVAGEVMPWGIQRVDASGAWSRGAHGQGVAVAVIDTGIAPHLDLARPVRGATFIPGSISFNDDHGHGTHVAGTIAARRGNGIGVVGVAPLAQLMAVKVLARDGYSRGDSVAHGITWAANNGAHVINLSLGSSSAATAMRRAVLYARSRNVVVCAAAGNDYGAPVSFPAAFDDVCIAVAATGQTNQRAAFSNRGPQLDLSAPGVGILSTYPGNGFRELNGTSMATPHVSGVAALLLSRNPGLPPLTLQRHLERTAIPRGPVNDYGRGIVQAGRAVATPIAIPVSAPVVIAPAPEGEEAPAAVAPRRQYRSRRQSK